MGIAKTKKEAIAKFKKACKEEKPKEIALASVEMLLNDKKRMKKLTTELFKDLEKIKREGE